MIRHSIRRLVGGPVLSAALLALIVPSSADAEITVNVSGAVSSNDFTATVTVRRFETDGGQLFAIGALNDFPETAATRNLVETLRIPVVDVAGTCEMVRLEMGPIDVDLDGPSIHLDQFGLHISDPGGGPLVQSLCSIARAPDDGKTLASLLNHVVDLLGCLMREGSRCWRDSA